MMLASIMSRVFCLREHRRQGRKEREGKLLVCVCDQIIPLHYSHYAIPQFFVYTAKYDILLCSAPLNMFGRSGIFKGLSSKPFTPIQAPMHSVTLYPFLGLFFYLLKYLAPRLHNPTRARATCVSFSPALVFNLCHT